MNKKIKEILCIAIPIILVVLFLISTMVVLFTGIVNVETDESDGFNGENVQTSTSILFDFIASWENEAMLHYIRGDEYALSYNASPFINEYVTEDKKYYICNTDYGLNNGTRNFGFGVMHYQNGRWNNVDFYKQEGVDIMQDKYTKIGTTLEVEIVDNVKTRIIEYMLDRVKNETNGLNLNQCQIHALVDIMYQNGTIGYFVDRYKTYGDTEQLKNNLSGYFGNNNRGEARWKLFHDGKYVTSSGRELLPSNYD